MQENSTWLVSTEQSHSLGDGNSRRQRLYTLILSSSFPTYLTYIF